MEEELGELARLAGFGVDGDGVGRTRRRRECDAARAVYEGTDVAALTEVAANSGYWGDQASFVRFAVVTGREYRIAIDSSGGTGEFTLNWMRP